MGKDAVWGNKGHRIGGVVSAGNLVAGFCCMNMYAEARLITLRIGEVEQFPQL